MNWVIVRDREAKNVVERYLVKDDGMTKGEIVMERSESRHWTVNLMMVPDLQFKSHDREQCIGYVRGVEATVNLYAKETGRKRSA